MAKESSASLEERLLEDLYNPNSSRQQNKATIKKLFLVLLLASIFLGVKLAGGIISGSLALVTDAAHMFTDILAFVIAILSIWISGFRANKMHSYGFHRASFIGAMVSVVVLWVLNAFLVYFGIMRIQNINQVQIQGKLMFIVACFGLIVNIIMALILRGKNCLRRRKKVAHKAPKDRMAPIEISADPVEESKGANETIDYCQVSTYEKSNDQDQSKTRDETQKWEVSQEQLVRRQQPQYYAESVQNYAAINYQSVVDESGNRSEIVTCKQIRKVKNIALTTDKENINIRATLVHVLGDILQSLSVIIVSIMIWISPDDMKIADPIVTFIIAFIVVVTSLKVIKECVEILMEGIPKGFSLVEFENEIKQLDGVDDIHDLHVWSLGVGKNSMSAHIYTSKDRAIVLKRVTALCREHGIYHSTVQVETTRDKKNEDYIDCKHNIHK